MNRGSAEVVELDFVPALASMRPRFMNRGSWESLDRLTKDVSRFNEAPIHESGKFVSSIPERIGRMSASMRPRFMNRGSRRVQSS